MINCITYSASPFQFYAIVHNHQIPTENCANMSSFQIQFPASHLFKTRFQLRTVGIPSPKNFTLSQLISIWQRLFSKLDTTPHQSLSCQLSRLIPIFYLIGCCCWFFFRNFFGHLVALCEIKKEKQKKARQNLFPKACFIVCCSEINQKGLAFCLAWKMVEK